MTLNLIELTLYCWLNYKTGLHVNNAVRFETRTRVATMRSESATSTLPWHPIMFITLFMRIRSILYDRLYNSKMLSNNVNPLLCTICINLEIQSHRSRINENINSVETRIQFVKPVSEHKVFLHGLSWIAVLVNYNVDACILWIFMNRKMYHQ